MEDTGYSSIITEAEFVPHLCMLDLASGETP
jgi:hypothetical protein